jgi:hypothetical protein
MKETGGPAQNVWPMEWGDSQDAFFLRHNLSRCATRFVWTFRS